MIFSNDKAPNACFRRIFFYFSHCSLKFLDDADGWNAIKLWIYGAQIRVISHEYFLASTCYHSATKHRDLRHISHNVILEFFPQIINDRFGSGHLSAWSMKNKIKAL